MASESVTEMFGIGQQLLKLLEILQIDFKRVADRSVIEG